MNKSQSAGYIILAIVVVIFTASVFMGGPVTKTKELSYSNFLEKLSNKEFSRIEKADNFLIAIPKEQPKQEATKSDPNIAPNPFMPAVQNIFSCAIHSGT